MQGAFDSDCKCGYIADNVLISVGNLRATTSIIIADISDEILLGDFIHRYQCILDLEHCQFGNKDSVVPLENIFCTLVWWYDSSDTPAYGEK